MRGTRTPSRSTRHSTPAFRSVHLDSGQSHFQGRPGRGDREHGPSLQSQSSKSPAARRRSQERPGAQEPPLQSLRETRVGIRPPQSPTLQGKDAPNQSGHGARSLASPSVLPVLLVFRFLGASSRPAPSSSCPSRCFSPLGARIPSPPVSYPRQGRRHRHTLLLPPGPASLNANSHWSHCQTTSHLGQPQ